MYTGRYLLSNGVCTLALPQEYAVNGLYYISVFYAENDQYGNAVEYYKLNVSKRSATGKVYNLREDNPENNEYYVDQYINYGAVFLKDGETLSNIPVTIKMDTNTISTNNTTDENGYVTLTNYSLMGLSEGKHLLTFCIDEGETYGYTTLSRIIYIYKREIGLTVTSPTTYYTDTAKNPTGEYIQIYGDIDVGEDTYSTATYTIEYYCEGYYETHTYEITDDTFLFSTGTPTCDQIGTHTYSISLSENELYASTPITGSYEVHDELTIGLDAEYYTVTDYELDIPIQVYMSDSRIYSHDETLSYRIYSDDTVYYDDSIQLTNGKGTLHYSQPATCEIEQEIEFTLPANEYHDAITRTVPLYVLQHGTFTISNLEDEYWVNDLTTQSVYTVDVEYTSIIPEEADYSISYGVYKCDISGELQEAMYTVDVGEYTSVVTPITFSAELNPTKVTSGDYKLVVTVETSNNGVDFTDRVEQVVSFYDLLIVYDGKFTETTTYDDTHDLLTVQCYIMKRTNGIMTNIGVRTWTTVRDINTLKGNKKAILKDDNTSMEIPIISSSVDSLGYHTFTCKYPKNTFDYDSKLQLIIEDYEGGFAGGTYKGVQPQLSCNIPQYVYMECPDDDRYYVYSSVSQGVDDDLTYNVYNKRDNSLINRGNVSLATKRVGSVYDIPTILTLSIVDDKGIYYTNDSNYNLLQLEVFVCSRSDTSNSLVVEDAGDEGINHADIVFYDNDEIISETSSLVNGIVQLNMQLTSRGTHTIRAEYVGSDLYLSSEDSLTIDVYSIPTLNLEVNGSQIIGQTVSLNAYMEIDGIPVSGSSVHFNLEGDNLEEELGVAVTDENGVASLENITLPDAVGTYSFLAYALKDNYCEGCSSQVTYPIYVDLSYMSIEYSQNMNTVYPLDEVTQTVTLTDYKGDPIINEIVTFTYTTDSTSESFTITTDREGIAVHYYKYPLKGDITYGQTVSYGGNADNASVSQSRNVYLKQLPITITLRDNSDITLAPYESIDFVIDVEDTIHHDYISDINLIVYTNDFGYNTISNVADIWTFNYRGEFFLAYSEYLTDTVNPVTIYLTPDTQEYGNTFISGTQSNEVTIYLHGKYDTTLSFDGTYQSEYTVGDTVEITGYLTNTETNEGISEATPYIQYNDNLTYTITDSNGYWSVFVTIEDEGNNDFHIYYDGNEWYNAADEISTTITGVQ